MRGCLGPGVEEVEIDGKKKKAQGSFGAMEIFYTLNVVVVVIQVYAFVEHI